MTGMLDPSTYYDLGVRTPVNERPWLVCEPEQAFRIHVYRCREPLGESGLQALQFTCSGCGAIRAFGAE
jgi:hypothetical protein